MTQGIYEIRSNVKIARDVYEMVLSGDTSAITAPGQFLNIKIEGLYLRRPISICDWDEETITILYKVVGEGTEKMADMTAGGKLDILVGLGNGFDMNFAGERPLLVGGGVGTPPMYGLCKRLVAMGKKPIVILGYASAEDVLYEAKFLEMGVEVRIATVDGTRGVKVRSRCSKRFPMLPIPAVSSALKNAWAAALALAWAVPARQNTAISVSAVTAPYLRRRK